MRQAREKDGEQNDADSPADGPPRLNRTHRAATKTSANAFSHQRGAHGPLPAKTKALQAADNE